MLCLGSAQQNLCNRKYVIMTKTLSLNGMCHGLKKWTKPTSYNGYNVKFVLLIIHFVAILKHNLSPWYCSYTTTIEPMKTQLSVWRWVLRSTQLCSALLVPSLHCSLCSNCSWNISPFYFYRRWVFVFFGFGFFFFFCKYGTYGSAHSPKAGPLRHSSPWFMCACVSSCQSLRKDRYESVGGFLKLPFLCLCSQISECRWEAMLK